LVSGRDRGVDSVGEMLICSGLFSFAGILVFIIFLLWKNVVVSCGPVRKGGGVKNMFKVLVEGCDGKRNKRKVMKKRCSMYYLNFDRF
jgi:hypothetical protein